MLKEEGEMFVERCRELNNTEGEAAVRGCFGEGEAVEISEVACNGIYDLEREVIDGSHANSVDIVGHGFRKSFELSIRYASTPTIPGLRDNVGLPSAMVEFGKRP